MSEAAQFPSAGAFKRCVASKTGALKWAAIQPLDVGPMSTADLRVHAGRARKVLIAMLRGASGSAKENIWALLNDVNRIEQPVEVATDEGNART
jgi:hypothetical protein